MAGLVPAIHVLPRRKTWMPTFAGMTQFYSQLGLKIFTKKAAMLCCSPPEGVVRLM